ncbi:MAG: serine/threonine-protein phosphatase [Spirochaetia bacterium]|nr:serine/threonine-protein phosphatase [Spirochaetia bacterium]
MRKTCSFDSRRFGVLVADVTGHGVGAALDSSTVKIAFRNEAPVMTAPSALLHGMNRFLAGTLDYRFVSAVYAFLDLDAMTITYASAGHPPILLLRGSELLSLDNEGVLLGFATDSEYAQLSTELLPGDRLLWYTDGLCDQIDPEDLPAVALHHAALKLRAEPLADFVPRLAKSMKRPKPYVQDDITLLAVGIQ